MSFLHSCTKEDCHNNHFQILNLYSPPSVFNVHLLIFFLFYIPVSSFLFSSLSPISEMISKIIALKTRFRLASLSTSQMLRIHLVTYYLQCNFLDTVICMGQREKGGGTPAKLMIDGFRLIFFFRASYTLAAQLRRRRNLFL